MEDQIKYPLQKKKKFVDGSLKYFVRSDREAARENCFSKRKDTKVDYASCFYLCVVITFCILGC